MDFRANNPGAVQYGNFINYYKFHSADDRLALFPPKDIWLQGLEENSDDKFVVLDVGCNSGDVTQLLYPFLKERTNKEIVILGIDIDPTLIKRAIENNKYPENVLYRSVDVMNVDSSYFDEFLSSHNKTCFDVVFCLSITMWIHLNHGDQGLHKFLDRMTNISQMLVIEPQPWKCYLSAVARMKKANDSFEHFQTIQIRNDVENEIDRILTGFKLKRVFETIPTKWNRRICFYRTNKL